jgi:hypothetical protein
MQQQNQNQNQTQNQTQNKGSSGSNNGVAISTTNKMVYIARVEAKYGERDIVEILSNARIGRVQYADMTAVKDNSPDAGPKPAFKFYSAFVMMSEWNPNALADLREHGQIKVWVDSNRTAYWVLRFATEGSEIPRSKVNTHQLAHYTAELYDRIKTAEKKTEEQATIIEDQNTSIAHMLEMMELVLAKNEAADCVLRFATSAAEGSAVSKVNIAELYDRIKTAEKKAEEQETIIEDQNTRMAHMLEMMELMLAKNEEMAKTIANTATTVSYIDAFMVARFAIQEDSVDDV